MRRREVGQILRRPTTGALNTVSWDKNGHLCVAGILKIYILPKQRSGGKNKWVKVGAMIVAAAKILDAIDVVDLQIHEDKLM